MGYIDFEAKFDAETNIWKIGSSSPVELLCIATDASGNVGTATATADLAYGDDGRSKDDGKSQDKSKSKKSKKALAVALPDHFELSQNHPNPFNPSTQIEYSLPEATSVTLTVYNSMGQPIAVLVDAFVSAGHHVAQWRADGISGGMYFYRLQAGEFAMTKRMVLLK